MSYAEEAPPYNEPPANENGLATDSFCLHSRNKLNMWKLPYGFLYNELQKLLRDKVDELRLQLKAVQLDLDIAEQEK